ncbi:MAG: DUF1854 domain-containing protein [Ruminococcaceae bacterium]|nr:DUF1854 domain-containing protein [Oscillospiraceae bacterium]MBQ2757986.1 DUF1854 domain-containing protein [Clostridia bacterium]
MARIYVDATSGKLTRTDLHLVRLTLNDGTVIEDLEPRRLFPVNRKEAYITLLDKSEKEVALVRDIAALDDDSAAALRACFTEYYRIPTITKLLESTEKFGSLTWRVMTDRGEVTFRIRNRHSDIKSFYGTGRILIRDTNDNRYEIADYTKLDTHSRHLLFSYL